MHVGSELTTYKSEDNYLVDALRLSLSISPYSVPCDTTAGLEVNRDEDIADLVRYQVIQILKRIRASGVLKCTSCYLDKGTIYVEITNTRTEEVTSYSFI